MTSTDYSISVARRDFGRLGVRGSLPVSNADLWDYMLPYSRMQYVFSRTNTHLKSGKINLRSEGYMRECEMP